MRFLRKHKILSAAALVVLIVVIAVATLAIRFVASFSPVPLVISKETTYITEPLRSDGTPDYVAALNRRLSAGVTLENNAAVLFWKAIGPRAIPRGCRARYFKLLGVAPLPEKGDYYVALDTEIDRRKRENELRSAMTRPWSKQEFPALAKWLETNEKPLTLVVEGTTRPRCYNPLVVESDEEMAMAGCHTRARVFCDFASLLVCRAMLRANDGRADQAWNDLLACHRLARLVGQGPHVIDVFVALTAERLAQTGERALLQCAKVTATEIAKMRADLAALCPMPRLVDAVDRGERLFFLDSVMWLQRPATTARGARGRAAGPPVASGIDWNMILRMSNSYYDRWVAAARRPSPKERCAAAEELNRDLHDQAVAVQSWTSWASLVIERREGASRRLGVLLLSLGALPAGTGGKEDPSRMESELTRLAFALAQYRVERGSYPGTLAEVAPRYVKELPKDIFNNDADLHYVRKGDGYLLYSVGPNGKDDGGKTRDDAKNGENWDDLVVRMSAAKP